MSYVCNCLILELVDVGESWILLKACYTYTFTSEGEFK